MANENALAPAKRFANYPPAVEGPTVKYRKTEDANPVFSGQLLAIGAWLVTKLPPVQKYLWSNAGFDGLRKLPYLGVYPERYDPTVIPLARENSSYSPDIAPSLRRQQPGDIAGRYYSIADYHALYVRGDLTPLEVVEYLLPLIRRDIASPSDHSVAFIDTKVELVMEAAKASTARYKAGTYLGVMDGVPTAIKDESDVAGYRTTCGCKKNDNFFKIAEESSRPVRLLQEAGAIILGKLNMHELGADTTNNNPNWGTPRNPHNDQYYTGGSSGGSGYVVATGLVPFAIGADGGGSIRIPSSFCGVYGLKPTHNRLEDTGSSVTVSGPLAGTVNDLEIAYRILAAPDMNDPLSSLFAPPGPFRSNPANPTFIGRVNADWNRAEYDSDGSLWNKATSHLENLGYQFVDIELPFLSEGQTAHAMTILAEMAARSRANPVNPSNWYSGLNPANKVLLAVGSQTPARDYLLAQQLRNMLMQHLAFLYKKYPGLIILTPTTPMAGWEISSEKDLTHGVTDGNKSVLCMQYVWLANFCGNPAISVPMGYAKAKKGEGDVPLGMMAMGEWGSEDELFAWARVMENWIQTEESKEVMGGGGRKRPSKWEDVIGDVLPIGARLIR